MRQTLGVLLAGGVGERLYPLTQNRAKPGVPFGGIYRIIDVTLSNCINSDLRKIFILTQYKALSLNHHVRHAWFNVFNKRSLIPILEEDARNPTSSHDFGKDVLPQTIEKYRVYSCHFVDENKKEAQYWLDVGTIQAYYEANLDLVAVSPQFNLYDKSWPIRTYQRQYPPAKFVFAQEGKRMGIAVDSIVSSGCIISGGACGQFCAFAGCQNKQLLRSG